MSLDHHAPLSLLPPELRPFAADLGDAITTRLNQRPHGRADEWTDVLNALPDLTPGSIDLASDTVRIGEPSDIGDPAALVEGLEHFKPWRKGPWELFGTHIDTEWRSDWKWQRIAPHLSPLRGRLVLDVGAGNGYYMLRCLGAGARFALGVDPTMLFLYQFAAVQRYLKSDAAALLPLRGEDLPAFGVFDTVFSLGVLYHRRSPIDHLTELLSTLRPGGELVLETLVIDGDEQEVMMPEERYAQMANVWFLPSAPALELWLARAGFDDVRTVDITITTTEEQRATEWMTFQSLADFLDPDHPDLTIEGLPAPRRATLIARRKSS